MTQHNKRSGSAAARKYLAGFLADRRGNLLPLFAIMLPVMLFTLGAAVDYTSAARRQEAIDGIADAAALAGTQPIMMNESCATSSNTVPSTVTNPPATGVSGTGATNQAACNIVMQQVVNVFDSQISALGAAGVSGVGSVSLTSISILDDTATQQRTVQVNWTGGSSNLFSGIIGVPTLAISGESVSKNSPSPVVLFYMLIDETPSMAFPAQPAGVTDMLNASPADYTGGDDNGGCSLGCHQADPNASWAGALYNPSNITCPTTNTAYSPWSNTTEFACVQGQSYTIKSGTYTASTGVMTFTLNSAPAPAIAAGQGFYLTGLTATGAGAANVGQLDSTAAGTGTGAGGAFVITSVGGNTQVTFTAPVAPSKNMTITGGTFTSQYAAYNTANPLLVGGASGAPAGSGTNSTIGCATKICTNTSGNCTTGTTTGPSKPQYTGAFLSGATPANSTYASFWGAEDAFALSRCLGVQLRIDLVNTAVSSLLTTAPTMAAENNTTYAVDVYAIDLGNNNTPNAYAGEKITQPSVVDVGLEPVYFWGCTQTYQQAPGCTQESPSTIVNQSNSAMTTNFGYATSAANTLMPLETYEAGQTTNGGCGDQDSPLDLSLEYLYAGTAAVGGNACGATTNTPAITKMAVPGNGLPVAGGAPEEVLYIVSDGMNDVAASGGSYPTAPSSGLSASCVGSSTLYTYYGRPQFCLGQTKDTSGNTYCTNIKNAGIRIAYLYLRYNTLNTNLGASQPSNGYYYDIEPWQYPGNPTDYHNSDFPGTYTDEIEQSAINCASPGLEFTVDTGANITSAMAALFQKAVQTAYLAH
jgi:Flp pilus assembly protein TadG